VAFVTGCKGTILVTEVVSTPKHYAVHSGPEPERHVFDAKVSEYDIVNTYLRRFGHGGRGQADSIMCVYNAVNGVPGAPAQTCFRSGCGTSGASKVRRERLWRGERHLPQSQVHGHTGEGPRQP